MVPNPLCLGMTHAEVIALEIEILSARIQLHDTGHIHTAIGVLRDRLAELSPPTPLVGPDSTTELS